jgi:putative hydrolase of the HAD superfamily
MTDYDAVFWDIGGVLLDLDSVGEGHRAFAAALAAEYDRDPEDALETWRATLSEYFAGREDTTYRPAKVGYGRAVEAIAGREVPESAWLPLFERATADHLDPSPGAVETVRRLDGQVYQGIVSDIDTWEAERLLEGFGVLDHLDDVTTSEAVGRTKPDPAMFETALEKSGTDPSRTLMVGDRHENDMEGGTRAGIDTVAFGGSAAAAGPEDPAVDVAVADLRELSEIVGVE